MRPETVESLTPDPSLPRKRYIQGYNQVLGGVLVNQKRRTQIKCSNNEGSMFEQLRMDCMSEEHNVSPFGVDPVFLDESSIFVKGLKKEDFYNASELDELGNPWGFTHSKLSGFEAYAGYPVLLDINMESSQAKNVLAYMVEGGYIDGGTSEVDIKTLTYNSNAGTFTLSTLKFDFELGGQILFHQDFQTFRVENYQTSADQTRQLLELIFLIFTVLNLVGEQVILMNKAITVAAQTQPGRPG